MAAWVKLARLVVHISLANCQLFSAMSFDGSGYARRKFLHLDRPRSANLFGDHLPIPDEDVSTRMRVFPVRLVRPEPRSILITVSLERFGEGNAIRHTAAHNCTRSTSARTALFVVRT